MCMQAVAGQNCSKCSLGGSQHFARQHLRGRISGSGRGGRRLSHIVHAGKDYYQVLGVGRDADKKALKAAYRYLYLSHLFLDGVALCIDLLLVISVALV